VIRPSGPVTRTPEDRPMMAEVWPLARGAAGSRLRFRGMTAPRTLQGMVALVTGAGSGIGRATAIALAARGAAVVVAGRRADALARTAAADASIRTVTGDVGVAADAGRIVEAAGAAAGRIDVLVNNAGAVRLTPLGETREDLARALWATNVLGPTLMLQSALPYLERSRGAVVNVSSTFGHKPAPGISQYGAAKAALEHLTRSWALELADRGVRVNAVAPGPTESEALDRTGLAPAAIEAVKEDERRAIPLGRRGQPEDVARWIAALADPAATWITGQVIGVDGGFGLV
jgi:NAD(P)-dependent dehydrogenase (short-subunit alcohol dehydrogenase family)